MGQPVSLTARQPVRNDYSSRMKAFFIGWFITGDPADRKSGCQQPKVFGTSFFRSTPLTSYAHSISRVKKSIRVLAASQPDGPAAGQEGINSCRRAAVTVPTFPTFQPYNLTTFQPPHVKCRKLKSSRLYLEFVKNFLPPQQRHIRSQKN